MIKILALFILASCSLKTTSYINPNIPVSQMYDYEHTMKHGISCAYGPLIYAPLINTYNEADTIKAASSAGISNLAVANYEYTTRLLFTQYCTHAYGY